MAIKQDISINLKGTGAAKLMAQHLEALDKAAKKSAASSSFLQKQVKSLATSFVTLAKTAIVGVIVAIGAAFFKATGAAARFEQAMAGVR